MGEGAGVPPRAEDIPAFLRVGVDYSVTIRSITEFGKEMRGHLGLSFLIPAKRGRKRRSWRGEPGESGEPFVLGPWMDVVVDVRNSK